MTTTTTTTDHDNNNDNDNDDDDDDNAKDDKHSEWGVGTASGVFGFGCFYRIGHGIFNVFDIFLWM